MITDLAFDFSNLDAIDIERRIRHNKITLADQLVMVFVETVTNADLAFEAMHGQVHTG